MYAGVSADMTSNLKCVANELLDGAMDCPVLAKYIFIELSGKYSGSTGSSMFSEIRIFSEQEMGRFISSWQIDTGTYWRRNPMRFWGLTK